jgi:hypothetical protein
VRQIRRQMHGEEEEEAGEFTGGLKRRDRRCRRRSGRRAVKTAAARRSRPNLSSRARFGARTGSTRRGERGELTQVLREVSRAATAARTARGRRGQPWHAGASATARCAKHQGKGRYSHHADKPRAKTMASTRRRRGRSMRRPELEDGGGASARMGGVQVRERCGKGARGA